MKNITLKAGQNLTVNTPSGKIVVGITNPYNGQPETVIYFSRDGGADTTKTVTIARLFTLLEEGKTVSWQGQNNQ